MTWISNSGRRWEHAPEATEAATLVPFTRSSSFNASLFDMSQNLDGDLVSDPFPPAPALPEPRSPAGWRHEDVIAIMIGGGVIAAALVCGWATIIGTDAVHPWKAYLGKPGTWVSDPITPLANALPSLLLPFGMSLVLFGFAQKLQGYCVRKFFVGFIAVFALSTLALLMSSQQTVKHLNLEYALWAIVVGLLISNTIGTPGWLRPALRTELYVKTGLVIMGVEVLLDRLLALGLPGVFVAWIVTPIVLISTYWFGQRVLKIPSASLNMVISADMSVCGVSAAIATAASCKAKKEELSLAIGMSLIFTVVMMIVMPLVVQAMGLSPTVGGAWIGGTVDSTGAVAAAGASLGKAAEQTAVTVKMIQNILIGATAFGVAVYWVTFVERDADGRRPQASEIWKRFPKFVLGFIAASIIATLISRYVSGGDALVESTMDGATKTVRSWFFCFAFVCIGLETRFADYAEYLKGGKPLVLYLCGQTLNLVLTLAMAYLMFGILFADSVQSEFAEPETAIETVIVPVDAPDPVTVP